MYSERIAIANLSYYLLFFCLLLLLISSVDHLPEIGEEHRLPIFLFIVANNRKTNVFIFTHLEYVYRTIAFLAVLLLWSAR